MRTEREERAFGTHLGRGLSVKQAATTTRQTTEGIKSAEAVPALADAHDVEMPIAELLQRCRTSARTAAAV
ncbi:NAD(P)H-dependent glycerol-3-phosphate dehydrogenase [Streptomyces sp. MMCC 100]|uniref:NAD(P)H-dependent glycerol-3-phosphate dehydrogenase n=1 Tax=Streptomyces sp. MMCC 100 TaxID=3163555 RepID=UPI00359A651D